MNGFAGCSSGFFFNVLRIVCSLTSFVVVVIFTEAQETYAGQGKCWPSKCWPSKCWPSTEGVSFWFELCTVQMLTCKLAHLLTWKLAEYKKGLLLMI